MWLLSLVVEYAAPFFLATAPFTSYADQILSIHRTKCSAGFSLDIPLIMLVASILKVFYWFGAYYSLSLLAQAANMIVVQLFLLKVALDNRPSAGVKEGIEHVPFSGQHQESVATFTRPYNFWRWKNTRPYWTFIAYFSATLFTIHVFLPFISHSSSYINLIGFIGLTIEAFLPVPQILANQRSRSCKGFRLSVLVSWLIGDAMKMSYLFYGMDVIPLGFKLCAIFQCICDSYLGVQYWVFGSGGTGAASSSHPNGQQRKAEEKDIHLT